MLEGAQNLLLPRDPFCSRSLSALRGQKLPEVPHAHRPLSRALPESVSKSAVGKEF